MRLLANKKFQILVYTILFCVAAYQRVIVFSDTGKDINAYQQSAVDLLEGRNPYTRTIASYENKDDPGDHGFAYLPMFLYIYAFCYLLMLKFGWLLPYLQKIPVLLGDLGVGLLMINIIKNKRFGTSEVGMFVFSVVSLLTWFFNPYFYLKQNYVYSDPLPVFFMLAALFYLEKDDVLAGSLFALSIALKTFPVLLLPLFFIKSKNKLTFLAAAGIVGLIVSSPFLFNIDDFATYIRGSLLVHSDRIVQGRPFLFFISYFYDIELFRIISFKTYTALASFGGWLLIVLFYYKKIITNKYLLAALAFVPFYLFTPVLNRTYLLWFLPLLLVGVYQGTSSKSKEVGFILSAFIAAGFWGFYFFYLLIWKDGFHIWHP